MESHTNLSNFLKGELEEYIPEKHFDDLKQEVSDINKKMKVLPTSREMDAKEDLLFLEQHSGYLKNINNPVFQILQSNPNLEKLIITDLFQSVATAFIKTRIYNNKSLIKVTDSLFINLITFISKNLNNSPKQAIFKLLNTIINPSGDFFKNNGQENVNKYPFGELLEISNNHKNWVDNLKINDKIDFLRSTQDYKIWTRAVIIENDYNLKIRFLNTNTTHYVRNQYYDIMVYKSLSKDFDWRQNLKKNDEIDFFRYKSKWNVFKIIDVIEEDYYGEICKKIRIVKKNDFDDSEEEYDYTEINVNSPSIAKKGFYSQRKNFTFDEDRIFLSKIKEKKFAIMRKFSFITNSSIYIIKYINEFGKNRGFEYIMKVVKKEINVDKEVFAAIITFLQSIGEFLVEPFIEKNGLLILKTIENYLLTNAEMNLREITPKTLQILIRGIKGLSQRIHSEEESEEIANKIKIKLAILCLKSNFLEKQFFGAKILTQVSTESKKNVELAKELVKFNVFDKIIKGHPHLIAKGEGVMKILFKANLIKEKDLLSLWEQILKTDIESRNSLLKLLSQVIPNLSDNYILFLANKMLESSNEINDKEIVKVLFEIQKMGYKRKSLLKIIKVINDTLWGVVQSSKKLKEEFLNDVIDHFISALENENNLEFINKIIDNILEEKNLFRNVLLMKKLIGTLNVDIREEVCKELKQNCVSDKILEKIYLLLKENLEKKNKKSLFNENEIKRINENFSLIIEINDKLEEDNLIKFESIEKIWDEIFNQDVKNELLLNWIKIFFIKSKSVSADTNFVNFFKKNILRMKEDNKEDYFYILVLIFFKIQIFRSNVIKKTIFLETPGVIRDFETSKEIFILNNNSESLKCYKELWNLFLETENPKLAEEISKFLIKLLFPKNSKTPNIEIYESEEKKLISKINELLKTKNFQKIKKAIYLIQKILKIKEESGFGLLTSFSSMLKLPKIILDIQQNKYYYKNSFSMLASLNSSLGTIRSKIAQTYEMEFLSVKIIIDSQEFPHNENSKTLSTLNFSKNEKWRLLIDEYPLPKIEEYPILNKTGENFTSKALKVFKQVFKVYSTNGKMTKKHLAEMTSAATDRMTCKEDDDRVLNVFSIYDPENKGFISEDRFIKFYLDSTKKHKTKIVRNNLTSFGFNKNLDSKNCVLDDNDLESSFRFKLLQDDSLFDILIGVLAENKNCYDLDYFFDFLKKLTPNQNFLKKISENPIFDIDLFFKSNYLWYYYCGILDSLLCNRNELLPFLTFLELEKNFNLENYLNQLFSKKLAKAFVESLDNINGEDSDNFIFSTSFGLFDKLLKICLRNVNNNFFDNLKNEEEEKDDKELKKKTSLSDDEVYKKNEKLFIKKDEELNQLKKFYHLADKSKISEFFENLDLLKINKFTKKFINKYIKEKKELDLQQINYIKIFLSIWINSIIGNKKIINDLLNSSEFEEFLISGLTHSNRKLRDIFYENYTILLESSQNFNLKIECLKIFIKNIQNNKDNDIQAIIEISSNLLSQISDLKNNEEILKEHKEILKQFDFLKLFKEFSNMLKNYQSKETFENKDTTLIAILSFMTKILLADITILKNLPEIEINILLEFLFTNCLFEVKEKSINFSNILCKSKNSRAAALKLLSQITYKKKNLSIKILKDFSSLSKFLPEQSNSLNFSNYNEKKSSLNFLGIKNPGCVCYMIAMLQQFYCTPTFRYGILMADDKKEKKIYKQDHYEIDDNVFHQLQKMFSYLDFSERKAFDPKSFCMSYMDITGQRVDITVQQDSQEFLNVIFDRLDRALKPTPFKGIMDSVFAGKIASVYTCKNCGNCFSNEQLFYNLSLEVKNMENIEDSFKKFNAEEIISDYTCENCKKKVDVSKRAFIKELPNVLIIHLQKIIFDLEYLANIKISSRFEFGKEIDLKNYVFKEKKNNEDENENDEEEEIVEDDKDEFTYKLVGVVLHSGNAEYGHYTSLINVNRKDPNRKNLNEDIWYNFDDSRISKYNMENFNEDCFGEGEKKKSSHSSYMMNFDSGSSKSAYILVYDKVKKSKIHFQFNEKNLDEKEKIMNCLIDKNNFKFKDNIFETDFYNIGKYLPNEIKTEINNDNSSLVLEDQLFNKNFTQNFSSLILNSGLPPLVQLEKHLKNEKKIEITNSQKELSLLILKILPLYIKKIYYVTTKNDSLPSLDITLRKAMIILKENCLDFFENLLNNDFQNNMNLLLTKSDCVIRKSMGNRTLSCFEIYAKEKNINLMIDYDINFYDEYRYQKTMEDFLDKIPSKYASNYRKCISYFFTLKKMVDRIDSLVNFVIKKGYLKKIIQFYINQDAKMTAERRVLVTSLTIFTLILNKYTFLPEEQKEEIKEEYEEALNILRSTDFFEKLIKEDYLSQENFQPIFDIISYLCKTDMETNNKFINKSLKSLSHSMHDNLITILEIQKKILLIKDKNQLKRIKNFLGETYLREDKVKTKNNKISYIYGLNREILQKRYIKNYVSFLNMDKGLISHLYKNRTYNETTCLLIIFFILEMCNQDDIFFNYFINLDGMFYNEPNNYCWFENYIDKTVQFLINKNQYSKKEIIIYCFKKIEKEFLIFKKKLEKKLKKENLGDEIQLWLNLNSEKIFCFGKQKWIIGKTNEVKFLNESFLNEKMLKFEFKLINVNLVKEESDGIKILSLPSSLLNEKIFNEKNNENLELKNFIGDKEEDYYEDKELYFEDENENEKKTNKISENNFFIKNDYILRISVTNFSNESHYVKLKISSQIENPNFKPTEIIIGVNRKKNDFLIFNIEKIDVNKNFEGLKIEAAFEEIDFLSFKDYEEEGLSDFKDVFIYK